MARSFRPYDPDQPFLLPPDLRDWVPDGHLSLFVSDVVESLDLSAILDPYQVKDGRGQPPYDPRMMVKLLVYAYAVGIFSSRTIERKTWEDVPFRVLASNQHPDHDTVASFRQRHLDALAGFFLQVLRLCQQAGLVKLGHVALDGTKINANASLAKSLSYKRMDRQERVLQDKIRKLLKQAEDVDAAEDARFGKGVRGDELPEDLRNRKTRRKRIQEAQEALKAQDKSSEEKSPDSGSNSASTDPAPADSPPGVDSAAPSDHPTGSESSTGTSAKPEPQSMAVPENRLVRVLHVLTRRLSAIRQGRLVLEAKARADASAKAEIQRAKLAAHEQRRQDGLRAGRKPKVPDATQARPLPSAQYNLTDPTSILMRSSVTKGFSQGFNAQAAVEEGTQIIVASALRDQASDRPYLGDLVDRVEQNLDQLPGEVSADAGFFSKENLALDGKVDLYLPPEREREDKIPKPGTRRAQGKAVDAMRAKLKTPEGRAAYSKRQETVEPVFGQIKGARGFRAFSFRGIRKAAAEWDFVCLTHNLLKLFRSGWRQFLRGIEPTEPGRGEEGAGRRPETTQTR